MNVSISAGYSHDILAKGYLELIQEAVFLKWRCHGAVCLENGCTSCNTYTLFLIIKKQQQASLVALKNKAKQISPK